ncbi:MAG: hypothetical protein HYU53_07565, partial [Acidobacteria bacterium]|nr:hypothetical protein [Acidobacteriota bacterium]
MTSRTETLRCRSLEAKPTISSERAVLMTGFSRGHEGRYSPPVMRGLALRHLVEHQTIFIGEGELIVGERGPAPKVVPTFPELTCHSLEDLRILNSRPKTWYVVPDEVLADYERIVIPYWHGRSLRDRMFEALAPEWHTAYEAGIFTEFMEQRAPGHTVLDDKIYSRGLLDFIADIDRVAASIDGLRDPEAWEKREALAGMRLAAAAVIRFAERHADRALALVEQERSPSRRSELEQIAAVCRHVPAHAPRTFWEALQAYWFCHLGVITELNGWDAFNPGHLDQHLLRFYEQGLADGTLTADSARELVEHAVNVPLGDPAAVAALRPFVVLADRLGRFSVQLDPGRLERVDVMVAGALAGSDPELLARAVLAGLLGPV